MTPEEHYARGLELLDNAERTFAAPGGMSPAPAQAAATQAAIAHGHFAAAAAGTAMRAFEAMTAPKADDTEVS